MNLRLRFKHLLKFRSIKNYISILLGFRNYIFKNKIVKELAVTRAKVCAACPHANPKYMFKKLKDKELIPIQGLGCDKCGCLISAKVRVPFEMCPDQPSRW